MAIDYIFQLDTLEIEEPQGFSDLELSIERDPKMHGVTEEASLNSLKFTGTGADYLESKKEADGIKAMVVFEAFAACDGYDFESVYRGRLNFGRYKKECGDKCEVSIPVEEESCAVILKARYDSKVDLDKTTAIDNLTALASYAGLRIPMDLPAREINARLEGYSLDDTNDIVVVDEPDVDGFGLNVRPTYNNELFNAIDTGQLIPVSNYTQNSLIFSNPISPQLLFEDNSTCFSGDFQYTFRFKGRYSMNTNATGFAAFARIETWNGEGDNIFNEGTLVDSESVYPGGGTYTSGTEYEFDVTITGSIALFDGLGVYGFLQFSVFESDNQSPTIHVEFDPETYVLIVNNKLCPTTTTDAYLIHETLSRVAESVTNGCMRVKSEYYGRTDSAPFEFPADGCGGVRFVTSGLKIRQAANGKFFASLKDLIEGLNAIDNIGTAIEPDTMGRFLLRVESLDYFYRNTEIFRAAAIPAMVEEVVESEHYARVLVGYNKWEVERINGLDEINSTREYSTTLDTISNTLDIKSNLVTGSYAIEVTRQQSLVNTGSADTKFDNDIFLISLFRGGYLYSELEVEQGNITGAVNIFSPQTIYNYRLSPLRNLMRWYRSIASGLPNLAGTQARLNFSAGTGNYTAAGEQSSGFCKVENAAVAENQNLLPSQIVNPTPLWRPENVMFEYPMALAEYQTIKSDPYGYVSYQCGTGEWKRGWLREIKYKLIDGMAVITLKKQWD